MDGFDRVFAPVPGRSTAGAPTAAPDGPSSRGRDSLFLTASLQVHDDPTIYEVRIRNLSAGGVMAEYPDHVVPGTAVKLDLRGIGRIGGKVAWSTQGRIGIALDRSIDPKRARKQIGGGAKTPVYAKSPSR